MKTRYNKFVLLAVFASVFAVNLVAQATALPYKNGFEGATTDWSFVSDLHNPANEWVVGSAVRLTGTQSLYVSADGGTTANYNDTASSTIFAYREFVLPEYHSYSIYFDWRSGGALGDSLYVCWVDGGQVIAPEANGSLPAWVLATQKLKLGGLPTTWQNASFSVCGTGQPAKLVFVWRNNGDGAGPSTAPSASRSPAGNIDNLQINQISDLNYITGFNSPAENEGWDLYNGSSQNKWAFGTANYFSPDGALYISKDGGATHGYANSASCVSAVKEFTLPAGETFNIDFEYMAGGESNDYLLVGWLTDTTRTNFTNTNGMPPTWFVNLSGVQQIPPYSGKLNNALFWKHFSATITGNGRPGKLILMWVNDDNVMRESAAIIDNFTVTKVANGCSKPYNITADVNKRGADGIIVPGITVEWWGNADSYNLSYYYTAFIDGEYQEPQYVTIDSVEPPYIITNIQRGIYSVVINGVCQNMPYCGANGNIEYKNDTSAWGAKHEILVAVSEGCIDYTDLSTTNDVTAEYGTWNSLGIITSTNYGLIDNGYADWTSRHTIHYIAENDTITNYGGHCLRTVPEGALASVRLGNKGNNLEWEGITYTFTVDSIFAVLILQYATVLEAPGHGITYDPKITLEILNANNQPVGGACGNIMLSSTDAPILIQTDTTWHYIPPNTIRVPSSNTGTGTWLAEAIYWKNWTTIGVNLKNLGLVGQRVKVRIRNYDCGGSAHFAYTYFTLDCAKAELEGLSCGDATNNILSGPPGFSYCWYKKYNPNGTLHIYNQNTTVCVSTERIFEPANTDTATYICRITSIATPTCNFDLTARLEPRLPQARTAFVQEAEDCQNIVYLYDASVVMYGNHVEESERTETSYWLVTQTRDSIIDDITTVLVTDTILISSEREPSFIASSEGGLYNVRLVSGINNDECTDTLNYAIFIEPISEAKDTTKITICYSQLPYTYEGKVYDVDDIEDGFIINNDTIITDVGCDSILTLILSVKDEILIEIDSTVCNGEIVLFERVSYYETGVYSKTYQNAFGCDSVMQLNLNVNPVIDVFVTDIPKEICADDPDFAVAYENKGGSMPTRYILTFNETAIDAGFENDTIEADGAPMVFVTIPDSLRPNHYSVRIEFVDDAYGCSGTDTTVNFDVLYPSYILEQKWNDVIALLKPSVITALPNYGHTSNVDDYTFSAYQWYKNNDTIIDGNKSYIYIKDGILDFDAKYTLLLTRLSDGVVLSTCSPVLEKRSEEIPVVIVQQRDGVKMLVQNSGVVNVYSVTGILLSSQRFNGGGEIIINAPSVAGVYILNINLDNGERYKEKIVVN